MTEKDRGKINTILIWAHLYDVLKKLWSGPGLSCLSSMIGKPLWCDEETAKETRLNYVRVCVEIKVGDVLPVIKPRFEGEEYVVHIDYPWKPQSYTDCNSFGHTTRKCTVEKQWKPVTRKQYVAKRNFTQPHTKEQGQTSGTKEQEMTITVHDKATNKSPNSGAENQDQIKEANTEAIELQKGITEFVDGYIVDTINIADKVLERDDEVVPCTLPGNNFLALAATRVMYSDEVENTDKKDKGKSTTDNIGPNSPIATRAMKSKKTVDMNEGTTTMKTMNGGDLKKPGSDDLSDPLFQEQEKQAMEDYNESLSKELQYLKQKSKCKWDLDGDSCTSYYHNYVKERKSRNSIWTLEDQNGTKTSDNAQVYKIIEDYYIELLGTSSTVVPDAMFFNQLQVGRLNTEQSMKLEEEG
ncbi:hypothetical protein FRX31_033418 [Thalictrum thalictroides]|uniref:DUF4283 domain-containing protein n=1 Tax=Thalictrum thalictroides TaxID=46969 RepID=A0A7J6UXT0_THATH|nr:hypothetical protein FRX31_033418 [Thalictrum thalictroides]